MIEDGIPSHCGNTPLQSLIALIRIIQQNELEIFWNTHTTKTMKLKENLSNSAPYISYDAILQSIDIKKKVAM